MDRNDLLRRITQRLSNIYGATCPGGLAEEIVQICDDNRVAHGDFSFKWDETDAVLITYADSINKHGYKPLEALKRFADKFLKERFSCIHLLPFFPSSSDDGFSVMDYMNVHKKNGAWDDILSVGEHFSLMYDFVLNHTSQHSKWFTDYLMNRDKAKDFFIECVPDEDYTHVLRSLNNPLSSTVTTISGDKSVWTTFSDDQIDLNYQNPRVLVSMLEVLAFYLQKQARIIRLDSIAYIWKSIGTNCMHLPQTHEIVKLIRDVAEAINPDSLIVTESNFSENENIAYFGNGDEAHLVYQFSLPCLLLHGLYSGNASFLQKWASGLPEIPSNCTYMNFTASNNGIDILPLEGVIPEDEITQLVSSMKQFGGQVNMLTNTNQTQKQFEVNITYFGALKGTKLGEDGKQIARFICSQAVFMALQGVPAFYIHSLLATTNDYEVVEKSGFARSLNRKRVFVEDVKQILKMSGHPTKKIFYRILELLEIRRQQPAFHPSARQEIIDSGCNLFIVKRVCESQVILAVYNFTDKEQMLELSLFAPEFSYSDIADGADLISTQKLEPYGYLWVELKQ